MKLLSWYWFSICDRKCRYENILVTVNALNLNGVVCIWENCLEWWNCRNGYRFASSFTARLSNYAIHFSRNYHAWRIYSSLPKLRCILTLSKVNFNLLALSLVTIETTTAVEQLEREIRELGIRLASYDRDPADTMLKELILMRMRWQQNLKLLPNWLLQSAARTQLCSFVFWVAWMSKTEGHSAPLAYTLFNGILGFYSICGVRHWCNSNSNCEHIYRRSKDSMGQSTLLTKSRNHRVEIERLTPD